MQTIQLGTTQLAYAERGTGDPLILIHGGFSDLRTWDANHPALQERYRVITYSRRYHWPNAAIPEGADYVQREHVEDLEQLMGLLGTGPAHLVGNSYGGLVALDLAIRQPGMVRSLVLSEPPVIRLFTSNTPTPKELLRLWLTRPRTALGVMKLGLKGIEPARKAMRRGDVDAAREAFAPNVLGEEWFRRFTPERREQAEANVIPAELLGSGFGPLEDEEVRSVRCPTLLLHGDQSPDVFVRLLDRLGELLPNAQRAVIPRASHLSHENNPDAWNAAVLSFLAKAS
jgi:pimeloyl-ACP methyl ester carboxylesterase